MKQNKNLHLLNEIEINSVIGGQQIECFKRDELFYSQNTLGIDPKKPRTGILDEGFIVAKR